MRKHLLAVLFSMLWLWAHGVENDSLILLEYHWVCAGETKDCSLAIDSQLLDYYQNQRLHTAYRYDGTPFDSPSNYSSFMFSEHDRGVIRLLVAQCCAADTSDVARIRSAVTFVQSLLYLSDEESKGVDEYVRYPVETLVEGVGDCEDKVVLLSAMFHEMGLDYVLFSLPDHLALGVHCNGVNTKQYIGFDDKRYYYVETTTPNWEIGQIPKEFSSSEFEVVYCEPKPILVSKKMGFQSDPTLKYEKARCHVHLQLFNMGPGKVTNVRLFVELVDKGRRREEVLMRNTFDIADLEEGEEREENIEFLSLIHGANRLRMTLYANGVPEQEYELILK